MQVFLSVLLLLLLHVQKAEAKHDYAGELRSCTDSDWVAAEKRKAFSVCNYIHNKLHFNV